MRPSGGQRWRTDAARLRERVASAAGPLFVVRVLEGLAAWVLFNRFLVRDPATGWLVLAGFVVYFGLNFLIVPRYRSAQRVGLLLVSDLVANLLPLALPMAASGGPASPLVPLLLVKALGYGIVYGRPAGVLACGAAAAVLVGLAGADHAGWLPVTPLDAWSVTMVGQALATGSLVAIAVAALLVLLVGRPETRVSRRPRTRALPPPPAVAHALFSVSEAISRLTGLEEILTKVVEVTPRSLDVDYCAIALWHDEEEIYSGAVAAGPESSIDHRFTGIRLRPEEAPDFEWARHLRHCAIVPASASPRAAELDVPDVLIAPLVSGDRFYGVILYARREASHPFTQRDIRIGDGIARQTAVALERARLVEDARRLVRALESTGEAIVITDGARRVIFVNRAFADIFGYRGVEVLGRDVLAMGSGKTPALPDLDEEAYRSGWNGEAVAVRRDGTSFPVLLDVSLIRDETGRRQGGVATIKDISIEKSFREHMQRADRLAALGQMAAGIAHEINNALGGIFGQTQERETRDEPSLRAALARVDGQARRIGEIVQGVLGFARPPTPRLQSVDLERILHDTADLVEHELERSRVTLRVEREGSLPAARADPRQIQQILLNLVTNAVHAMHGSERREIAVRLRTADDQLAIDVGDSGPGIDAAHRDRIFDPFFSTKSHGTGLGLSVSYAIAQAHGGDLQVQSAPGRGATFTLFLPRAADGGGEVRRVLLVDDDEEVAEALADMLEREGVQVERAATGERARERLARETWDAVFLDMRLPDISGADILAELQQDKPALARRVVVVTGGLWRAESRLRRRLSGQRFLAKPCTQEQVREVLRSLRDPSRAAA